MLNQKLLVLACIVLLTSPIQGQAHNEDQAGCIEAPRYQTIRSMNDPSWEGVSSDHRDYIVKFQIRKLGYTDLEYRFILDRTTMKPKHWNPIGIWVDRDSYPGYEDWWIDPRNNGDCNDFIHLKYLREAEHWVLWISHHDDRKT